MLVIDAATDANHAQLAELSKHFEFPAYVKSASLSDLCSADPTLGSLSFADADGRRFKVHTKEATWVSWLYFLTNRSQVPAKLASRVEDRLTKMAAFWGIQRDVESLRAKHASITMDRLALLPDSAFLIVTKNASGSPERHYPLGNPAEVVKAAEWFAENRYAYPFAVRQEMAEKILDKAAEFAADVPEDVSVALQKQAGRGMGTPDRIIAMVESRARAGKANSPETACLNKLAADLRANPSLAVDIDAMKSLASTIDQVDRARGYTREKLAREQLPLVEDVLFRSPVSVAATFVKTSVELATGNIYQREQLTAVPLGSLQDVFGIDFVKQATTGVLLNADKMAKLARAMSSVEAGKLEDLLADAGQRPTLQRVKRAGEGLTVAQLADLAQIQTGVNLLTGR